MLPLKSSRNEQRAVIRFFCGQKDLMQMRFTLRCVQCMATSVLRDQQYTFGVRSFAAEKALLLRNDLAGMLLRRPMPRLPQLSKFFCTVRWDKCLKELGRYVEKWNINV